MKTTLLSILLALTPALVSADENTARARIENLEKAVRLQTLATEALRKDDYDLACKAQREATNATRQANIKDVNTTSDMQFAEICTVSRAIAKPNTPSWLTPVAGFEPAGFYIKGQK